MYHFMEHGISSFLSISHRSSLTGWICTVWKFSRAFGTHPDTFISDDNRDDDATAMRASLKKWICVLSAFITIIPTHLLCQLLANPPGVEFLGTYPSAERETKFRRCLFTSSIKRGIRHFHVVVVQSGQSHVQKSVMHVKSCCFAY